MNNCKILADKVIQFVPNGAYIDVIFKFQDEKHAEYYADLYRWEKL